LARLKNSQNRIGGSFIVVIACRFYIFSGVLIAISRQLSAIRLQMITWQL